MIEGIETIFHVNVNCSNFERSLAFYKNLGFKVVINMPAGGNKKLVAGLGLDVKGGKMVGRAAIMMLRPDDKLTARLDLIEWRNPPSEGKPYPHLHHLGISRIALLSRDVVKAYEQLKADGVECFSEPQVYPNGDKFICFKDPDGTILELIEFGNRGSASKNKGEPGLRSETKA